MDPLELPDSFLPLIVEVLGQSPGLPLLLQRISGWLEGQGLDPTASYQLSITSASLTEPPA